MEKQDKSVIKKVLSVVSRIFLVAGVIIAFYKMPSIIAEKISYWQIKNKKIKQDFTEENE